MASGKPARQSPVFWKSEWGWQNRGTHRQHMVDQEPFDEIAGATTDQDDVADLSARVGRFGSIEPEN